MAYLEGGTLKDRSEDVSTHNPQLLAKNAIYRVGKLAFSFPCTVRAPVGVSTALDRACIVKRKFTQSVEAEESGIFLYSLLCPCSFSQNWRGAKTLTIKYHIDFCHRRVTKKCIKFQCGSAEIHSVWPILDNQYQTILRTSPIFEKQ